LRFFGYNDELKLSSSLFKDEIILNPDGKKSVELSPGAHEFLIKIYSRFKNYLLEISKIDEIFYPYGGNFKIINNNFVFR